MSKRRVTYFFKPKVQSVSVENIDEPPKKTPNLTVIPQEQETVHADKPFHPTREYVFPKSSIGKRDRSCQHNWFKDYPWLHYDER